MYGLPWITILCHEWGDTSLIFTNDAVTSENHWRIASWITPRLFVMVSCTSYHYFILWTQKPDENNNQLLVSPFISRTNFSNTVWWRQHRIPSINLWRHVTAKHWHFDVILVDCSCTLKLVLSWYSLVNNNREYWFSPPAIHGVACNSYIILYISQKYPTITYHSNNW